MSLILPQKQDLPVFDIPNIDIYKSEFVDRRILTVAGKAVLSEKNQPTKPSNDYKFRKCYVAYHNYLYKYSDINQDSIENPKKYSYRTISHQESDYSVPLSFFYIYRKLKQKNTIDKIITNNRSEIPQNKLNYKNKLNVSLQSQNFKYSSKQLNINNHLSYPKNKLIFYFQLSDRKRTKNILYNKNFSILNKTYNISQNSNIIIESKDSSNNEINLSPIYDFTKFSIKKYGHFKILDLPLKFLPQCDIKKVLNKLASKNKIYFDFQSTNTFDYVIRLPKEVAEASETFAKFYITSPAKLIPYIKNLFTQNTINYNLNISHSISKNYPNTFIFRYDNKKGQESYKTIKKSEVLKINVPKKQKYNANINSELTCSHSLKDENFNRNKTLIAPLKYRNLKLALKLSIFRPKFSQTNLECKIQNKKHIEDKIIIPRTNKSLLANYNNLKLKHFSPKEFSFSLEKESYKLNNLFKIRKSYFFNKSPRHANYSYKKLHSILSAISLKRSKILKITKAFSLRHKLINSLNNNGFRYTYNLTKIKKELYVQKPIFNRIDFSRIDIKKILYSDKFNNINKNIDSSICLTLRNRIGLNHLKRLKSIFFITVEKKYNYNYSYLEPIKRISSSRLIKSINKGLFSLKTQNSFKEIYINQKNDLDSFAIKYLNREYDYCRYLPNQIVELLPLNLNIISIRIIKYLSQKNIIPPPGWKKINKKYNCKLKLGPFPFGFPNFSIVPPVFITLTTRDKYAIKDFRIDNIFKESFFILTKTKLYLHELSMKKPKRLLFTDITPQNSPKEYYRSKQKQAPLQLDKPASIKDFFYTWKFEKSRQYITTIFNKFLIEENNKTKKHLFVSSEIEKSSYNINSNYLPDTIESPMPNIEKLMLIAPIHSLNNGKGLINLNGLIHSLLSYFKIIKTNIINPGFLHKELFSGMKESKEWIFTQKIQKTYPAKEIISKYTTRFRTFHFPYIPETHIKLDGKLIFADELDYTSYYSCKFQEDFRLSQFDFGLLEIQKIDDNIFEYDTSIKSKITNSFTNEADDIYKNALNNFIQTNNYGFHFNKFDIPSYYQHLITPRFFKIRERFSYKYMRRRKALSLIRQIKASKLPNEKYYNIKPIAFNSMESPSFHWIILLRKNQNLLYTYLFDINARINNNRKISVSYKFSEFKKEIYKSIYEKFPKIEEIEKSNLLTRDYRNKLINYSDYYSIFVNNDTDLSPQISLVHTNKTFAYYDKKRLLEFKAQVFKKEKEKVLEPNYTLENSIKGKISFSARIDLKENPTFVQNKSYSDRIAFKPIYIPDIIDINTNNDKITKLEIQN